MLSSVLWTCFIKLALLRLNLRYYIKHDVSCMFSETYRNYFFTICYNWVCGRRGESALPDLMFRFRQIAFSQAFILFFSSSGWILIDIGNSCLVLRKSVFLGDGVTLGNSAQISFLMQESFNVWSQSNKRCKEKLVATQCIT